VKIGIMGGTFDPVHLAHLIIAEQARVELKLDKIIFIPVGKPWMKSDRKIADSADRVEMVRLAIQSNASFSLSTLEVERPGSTFTVDTLEQLWQELGLANQLFLLLGWDSLKDLPAWKAPYRISKIATIVAFPRPGFDKPDTAALEAAAPGISKNMVTMDRPLIGISSTDIRERVASGKSIRYLVPDAVADYIISYNLYAK